MALKRLLERVARFSPFRFEYVEKVAELSSLLKEDLEPYGYFRFVYPVTAPSWSWYLEADGEEVRALPFGLSSGEYEGPPKVVETSLSEPPPEGSLAYVPGPSSEIKTPVFSQGAALAVSPGDAERLKSAKEVKWRLKTRLVETFGEAFMVGDLDKAKKLVVVHYDSLWAGAVDNASGVAVALELLDRTDLSEVAFAFIGFSEINVKKEEYWLPSFESVASAFPDLLERVSEVIVVDCLGTGKAGWIEDAEYVEAYSPFGREKLKIYGTPLKDMADYYHGSNDAPDKVLPNSLFKDLRTLEKHLAQG